MRATKVLVVVAALATAAAGLSACGTFLALGDGADEPPSGEAGALPVGDAALDALVSADGAIADAADAAPPCKLGEPFSAAALIVTSANPNASATLSEDELTIFVDNDLGSRQAIFVSRRASVASAFPAGSEITGPVASANNTLNAALSTDGLGLIFVSELVAGQYRLYQATRSRLTDDFGVPVILGAISSAFNATDLQPFVTTDGDVWFISDRGAVGVQFDVFRSPALADGGHGTAAPATALNSPSNSNESKAVLSRDGLRVFFGSERPGGPGGANIWTATRPDKTAEFGAPSVVAELNTASHDRPAWISRDSCRLYISSDRSGKSQIYVASRPPN